MQFLKNNQIIREYILPIILFPLAYIVFSYLVELVFEIGKIYGTFFRGLYQIVLNSV